MEGRFRIEKVRKVGESEKAQVQILWSNQSKIQDKADVYVP